MKNDAIKWIETHEQGLINLSDKIWDLAEIAFQENFVFMEKLPMLREILKMEGVH